MVPSPTVWDDDARAIFTHGHCHSLAAAFLDAGWQVRALVRREALPEFRDELVVHFFAVDPDSDGHGWDAYGRQTIDQVLARFPGTVVHSVSDARTAIDELVQSGRYLPVDVEAGRWAYRQVLATRLG